jgi:amino-acid N-acetyltransferase
VSGASTIAITPARPDDVPAILALLSANGLPTDGFEAHAANAYVARREGELVGAAALESYLDGGLLRSVVVSTTYRGERIGQRLVEHIVDLARAKRLPVLYLLTTTAADYFPKLGFAATSRESVPEGVRQSLQFTTVCPASAAVLMRVL